MKILSTIVLSAALAFAAPAFAGWAARDVIQNHEHVAAVRADGSAMTVDQVKKAIVAGATAQKWQVQETGLGKLTLTLVVRNKHSVVVEVDFSDKGYSIKYVSSINMSVGKDEEGRDVIHHNYTTWIDNLMLAVKTAATAQP